MIISYLYYGKDASKMEENKRIHWVVKEEPLAGSSLTNIFRLLWQNKFRIHPKYWPRFWYAITLSTLCLPLRWVERITLNRKVKKITIDQDPLFIIGHY